MNDIAIFCNGLMLVVNGLEYIADAQSIYMTRNNNYAGRIYLREGKLKYTSTSIYGVKCYDLVKI